MNEIIEKDNIIIENMIYEIRGKQVMLDSDLAKLYSVKTKRINEAVKNNPNKFPERFSFILSNNEKNNLWSKFSTANINNILKGKYEKQYTNIKFINNNTFHDRLLSLINLNYILVEHLLKI